VARPPLSRPMRREDWGPRFCRAFSRKVGRVQPRARPWAPAHASGGRPPPLGALLPRVAQPRPNRRPPPPATAPDWCLIVCTQGAHSHHRLDLEAGQLANSAETLNTVNFTSVFEEPRNAPPLVSDRGCCSCVHHLRFSSRAKRQPRGEWST